MLPHIHNVCMQCMYGCMCACMDLHLCVCMCMVGCMYHVCMFCLDVYVCLFVRVTSTHSYIHTYILTPSIHQHHSLGFRSIFIPLLTLNTKIFPVALLLHMHVERG